MILENFLENYILAGFFFGTIRDYYGLEIY